MKSKMILLMVVLLTSSVLPMAARADAARPMTPATGLRSAPAEAQANSSFNRLVLNQLLNALGKPNFQVRFQVRTTDQGTSLRALSGRAELRFRRDISFPLQEATNQTQLDRLIPMVQIGTNGGTLVTRVTSDDENDRMTIDLSFVRPQSGNFLPVSIRSELVDFIALQIEGLQITLSGLRSESGQATATGTCSMKQAIANAAGQNVWQPVDCRFSGRYDFKAQTYQVDFSYDSLGR